MFNGFVKAGLPRTGLWRTSEGKKQSFVLFPPKSQQKCFHLKGVTEVKPIIYGNISRAFGKKREEDGHTHQWTVYVKPYINEDMQTYVKKVHFKLHESYESPNRIVTKPPYEVSETGWGEFEVVIKIYFHDPTIYK